MILVFLGPPGSGKGTQAKRLVKDHELVQLSTGDMLRAAIAAGTALGIEARKYMDQGKLVPDSVVVGLIDARTREPDCTHGFILDGFPRTLPQAESLERLLSGSHRSIKHAVLFDVPDEELVRRLSARRSCAKCGAVYNLVNMPPKITGKCDACGASEIVQRSDDQPDVIRSRLKVYHEQTAPLEAHYASARLLRKVDATKDPDEVYREVLKIIGK